MRKEFVAYNNLRVFPYELTYIKDMSIENSINNHAVLKMTGIIDDGFKDSYVTATNEESNIVIYYETGESSFSLFNGVVTNIKVNVIDEVYTLSLEAISYTYIMDLNKVKRDFQNTSMTTHELIDEVMKTYSKSVYNINIPNEPIEKYILQYNETDWEFLKRIASFYNQPLITAMEYDGVHFYIGTPEIPIEPKAIITKYKIRKSEEEFNYVVSNDIADVLETDFINYIIRTQEIYSIGENFQFKNYTFYVKRASYTIDEGKLENIYVLAPKGGMRAKRIYNKNIIGISITGSILEVKRDIVRVNLEIGEEIEKDNAYWFPYATVAASPTGGGWYCMPEVGERIRLECPTKDETEAFVVNAIDIYEGKQGSEAEGDRMSTPTNKSLQTAAGQEVKFTPNGVNISSTGSEAVVNLNNDGTIEVIGQKNVNVSCGQTLDIRAENELSIYAGECIDIACESGSSLILSKGDEILINGMRDLNNG